MIIYVAGDECRNGCVRLAQLDRAFGYGPKGRGFESSNARYCVHWCTLERASCTLLCEWRESLYKRRSRYFFFVETRLYFHASHVLLSYGFRCDSFLIFYLLKEEGEEVPDRAVGKCLDCKQSKTMIE